jgi:prevent-host-death family protein
MRKMDLSEAQTHLTELIKEAAQGEEVIITQGDGLAFKIVPMLPELHHGSITLSRPAKFTYNTLLPEDRKSVTESINQLEGFSDNALGHNVKKLALDKLYMTKAGDLRIIFRVDDDSIEIEDIFHKDRLKKFKT